MSHATRPFIPCLRKTPTSLLRANNLLASLAKSLPSLCYCNRDTSASRRQAPGGAPHPRGQPRASLAESPSVLLGILVCAFHPLSDTSSVKLDKTLFRPLYLRNPVQSGFPVSACERWSRSKPASLPAAWAARRIALNTRSADGVLLLAASLRKSHRLTVRA